MHQKTITYYDKVLNKKLFLVAHSDHTDYKETL